MSKNFFSEILLNKPELVSQIILYNGVQQEDLFTNILEELSSQGVQSQLLWDDLNPFINKEINYFDKYEQVISKNYWDFADESKRLVFLPSSILEQAIIYFGVLLNAKEISKCINKALLIEVKECIGDLAYQYAINRGQFQLGTGEDIAFLKSFAQEYILSERIIWQGIFAIYICTISWEDKGLDNDNLYLPIQWDIYEKICLVAKKYNILPNSTATDNINEETQDINRDLSPSELLAKEFNILLNFFPHSSSISQKTKRYVWFTLKKLLLKEFENKWAIYFN